MPVLPRTASVIEVLSAAPFVCGRARSADIGVDDEDIEDSSDSGTSN